MKNNSILDEKFFIKERLSKFDAKQSDTILKRQTRNIANSAMVPVVNTIYGNYINPFCHILDSMATTHPLLKK